MLIKTTYAKNIVAAERFTYIYHTLYTYINTACITNALPSNIRYETIFMKNGQRSYLAGLA